MKRRIYTNVEMSNLMMVPYVLEIKYKRQLVYSNKFKLWAVLKKKENCELTCKEIFELAGFDTNILHNRLPDRRINDWTKCYDKYGLSYFNDKISLYKSN